MAAFLFSLFFLITLFLTYFSYKYAKNLHRLEDVSRAKRLSEVSICGIIAVSALIVYSIARHSISLSVSFVAEVLLLTVAVSELWPLFQIRYRLSKSPCDLIGNYYISKHAKHVDENDIPLAEAAILKACMVNPQNPKVWILRANFTDEPMGKLAEAKKYLEVAEQIIQQQSQPTDEVLAEYEFCQANLLISENNLLEALVRLKKSQDLVYSDDKLDLIEKIKANIIRTKGV